MAIDEGKAPSACRLRNSLRWHEGEICQIAWSTDGRLLAASFGEKGTVRLWEVETGRVWRTLDHAGLVHGVAWSPNGRTLVSAGDKTVRLWDAETGELRQRFEGQTPVLFPHVGSVTWSPDGTTLASALGGKQVLLWDAESGLQRRVLGEHSEQVCTLAWSPDGGTLASGSHDNTVRLWEPVSGELRGTLVGHSSFVHSVAWSPDGRTLASGSADRSIRLWDPEAGRETRVLTGHDDEVTCVSFSSDGYLLASKALVEKTRLWRCDTWAMTTVLDDPVGEGFLFRWLIAHSYAREVSFHPSAPVLATLGEKYRVVHIWDLDIDRLLNIASSGKGEPVGTGRQTSNTATAKDTEIGRGVAATGPLETPTGHFDVFLCHNSADKPAVKEIGKRLKHHGLRPWLDEWELRPGLPWQKSLEDQIKKISSVAVFVGTKGIGPWQDAELAAFLRQFVRRECPVIPVILEDCERTPELPPFLEGMMWVDFRKKDPDPMKQLIWGITGKSHHR